MREVRQIAELAFSKALASLDFCPAVESTAKTHNLGLLFRLFCASLIAPALRRLQHTRDPALCLKSTASSKSAFGSTPETTMKAWLGLEEKEQSYMDLGGSNDAENPLTQAANSVAGAARTASISARRAVGMQVPVEEQTIEEQVCEMCPTMTFKQRLIALICCCVLGYILEICGTLTLIGGPTARNIRKFSVLYVCGNLIAIMATAFWVGPKLMCKKMWNSTRRGATAMYLVSLVLVLVLALLHVAVGVVLLMLAVELFCAVWYSASYVPKGRWCVVQCCKNTLFSPCPEVLDPVQASLPTV